MMTVARRKIYSGPRTVDEAAVMIGGRNFDFQTFLTLFPFPLAATMLTSFFAIFSRQMASLSSVRELRSDDGQLSTFVKA